ncbi:MAG: prepilin-type N-terminal cleavage/methylation domain-containing protein [Thermoguttaceae bacterium]|nr:prepilin-type N-terminal cleavage/methylation domain-containing protein [Thermoguttaceae bacterium]MDW8078288.1 prepilin-type N-terminal cleavage/methylation domain-containing protein [Thermoguttaceae bacterium]
MPGVFRRSQSIRGAFSLLEVILALAILGGALAVLGEVARMAMRNAARTRDLAQAQLLCEAKLAEILAGVEPPEPITGAPMETGQVPDWLYSIDVAALDVEGLIEVRVTVEQDLPPEKRPVRYTLVRWMVDPLSVTEVDLVAEAEAASEQASTGQQRTGTQSGSSQTGTSGTPGGGSGTPAPSGGPSTEPSGGAMPGGPTPSTPGSAQPPQGPNMPPSGTPGGGPTGPGESRPEQPFRGR